MTNIKTERAKTVTTPNLGVFDSHNVPGNPTSGGFYITTLQLLVENANYFQQRRYRQCKRWPRKAVMVTLYPAASLQLKNNKSFKAFRDREKCVRCYSSSRIDSGLVVKEAAEERKRCAAATST